MGGPNKTGGRREKRDIWTDIWECCTPIPSNHPPPEAPQVILAKDNVDTRKPKYDNVDERKTPVAQQPPFQFRKFSHEYQQASESVVYFADSSLNVQIYNDADPEMTKYLSTRYPFVLEWPVKLTREESFVILQQLQSYALKHRELPPNLSKILEHIEQSKSRLVLARNDTEQ
ncbi:hypothetical protein GUITHDRAFT_104884 [Guillardia theta CCMP2712]|uniref:Uncharacterized protein n=1 Tax=Guillardia theta (strain CCMP2712) TaxID=905079 RepID=L1JLW3_GUITC|nr:hypothetical protein GUITHDRAFT_104884 [Guillardia theta CCMP2712]EKX49357.1 hypothetical protein GUITHDRAFT_104884 [Guillardia theta CCMP2712]|eukprot:XP_005836337.1 hypothetical protein GUITHDRAFT_104884 [Guillardia theta CCMP2712]